MLNAVKKFAIGQAFNYIEKDPIKNLTKVMDMVDKFAGEGPQSFPRQRKAIRDAVSNEGTTTHKLVERIMTEIDVGFAETLLSNFFVNASLTGWKKGDEIRQKYNCNVPWASLLDPTSACNLHCKGCWAAEYGNKLNLSYDEIDDIIRQGKDMGTYFYIYTGGEPLVRKKDIMKLCEKHNDAIFMCFTNATLIDDEFAEFMLRAKNFVPVISVEGFEEATDSRRGKGTYSKVIKAMELLKDHHLPF
ncbi:MAG: radical SAM protein, partial [Lachnospiraceae bacterium]|nr:radical SAM protein [Lachnospiraceae bacterium]